MRIPSRFYHWCIPPVCILCGDTAHSPANLCQPCQQSLPILSHACPQCAQFLPPSSQIFTCGTCLTYTPPFDKTYALFPYAPPIVQLIIQLKFRHQLCVAQTLGSLLAETIKTKWYKNRPLPDLIIPMPLHKTRLKARGFNQALEIARPVAKALSLQLDIKGIERMKATAAQSTLSASLRKKNMAHAFTAHRSYTGLSVAVLDDVITTGHTMTEFCKILKQKGAKSIDVWCCARRDIAITAKTL